MAREAQVPEVVVDGVGEDAGEDGSGERELVAWAVCDVTVAECAHSIAALHRSSSLSFAVGVGRLILSRFYGGDIHRLRERSRKDMSLRRLAAHPAMPLSRSGLHQAVAVFELVQRLGGLARCQGLGVSHLRAVLPVPEPHQPGLIERAVEAGWSVARLKAEIPAERARGGGRPPLNPVVKAVRRLARCVDGTLPLLTDRPALRALAHADARALHGSLQRLEAQARALRLAIEASAAER